MTPKEKASRLVADFIKHSRAEKDIKPIQSAKKCALIAVDFAREFITGDLNESFDKTMYLFEVKQEIENL
jgi:hypothetical protein